jgi:glycosyltransferase involved in cell wall biosynthesis
MIRRALFVTHDLSIYGASRSLQTLLRNYSGVEIDLVIRKRLVRKNNIAHYRQYYGSHIRKIMEYYLPIDSIATGDESNPVFLLAGKIQWERNKGSFYNMIKENDYDFIHLNSLVLHQIIDKRFPFFIHVREIFNNSNTDIYESFKKVKGAVFIDEATKASFKQDLLPRFIVLNNPFDMTGFVVDKKFQLKVNLSLPGKTIFSIIGSVADNKGVDFVIRAFKEVKDPNNLLLIVGRGVPNYLTFCKSLAAGDSRIVFYGEEPEILNIYAISDYIVRGEAYPCIGRTIYEGLYSGCHVMVPGSDADKNSFFDYPLFRDNIHIYTPRNILALAELMKSRSGKNVVSRTFRSNIMAHIEMFNHFISNTLSNSAQVNN